MQKRNSCLEDTIVAISTPVGVGGLGIVRLSGNKAIDIASKIFFPKNKNKNLKTLPTFTVTLGKIIDEENVVDEVLMILMRAPKSYTCEDVVEFSCHGGITILRSVVELCLKHGARIAEPGEFTKRAFLNGRIDLSQAESVSQLINAKTSLQHHLATKSLLGVTRNFVEKVIEQLKHIIAEVEVTIDYPEEENILNEEQIKLNTKNVLDKLNEIIKNSEKLSPLLNGLNVAIVGKPNVGKSSLLNVLLNYDRAIVSDIPGTTRDTISEVINLNNIPVKIIDTAGIRTHSQNVIEKIGIQKTKSAVEEADLILFVIDARDGLTKEDYHVLEIINEAAKEVLKKIVFVVNKIDLNSEFNIEELSVLDSKIKNNVKIVGKAKVSCKNKSGINNVENLIIESQGVSGNFIDNILQKENDTDFVLTSLRQIELVKNAVKELSKSLEIKLNKSPELFCQQLSLGAKELLKITGGEITEDVLDIIFSKFCVGK